MAQYTPNFNLYEPDSSDDFADFRTEFNNNMNIIDQNLGGGGSGGHTIYDKDGNALAQESGLQFTGAVNVSDDNVNGKTIVDILGGGGVYGLFIDTSKVIASATVPSDSTATYTATEDCYFVGGYYGNADDGRIEIDGKIVSLLYVVNNSAMLNYVTVPVRKGQVVTIKTKQYNGTYTVYGTINGSNPIFAPIIYSDTEREVGVWRDNKPLYQRTVEISNVSYDSNWHSVAHGISNIEFVAQIKGIMKTTSNYFYNCDVFRPSTTLGVVMEVTATNINYINSWIDNADKLYVTLLYTKTTDVAGSGDYNTYGVPTVHYSTSEQVIGTWIDGKPLYERTLSIGALPNANESAYPHNISDLKDIIEMDGMAIDGSGNNVPIIFANPLSTVSQITAYRSGANIYVATGLDRRAYNGYITVRYTKTTD